MRLLSKLCLGAMVASLSVPSGFAKIYPDDFLIQPVETSSPFPTPQQEPPVASEPFFYASEIQSGKLTRAQFIDAIATRLYDADAHDNCFGDLVLSETYDYSLLYNDVSLDAPYASSICLGMRNGLIVGYSDGNFRPNTMITVAEAAAVFGRIGGLPLRDSNHLRPREVWYQRFIDAMRAVDREFTMQPWETFTGAHVKHSLCVLTKITPELDPLGEFGGC